MKELLKQIGLVLLIGMVTANLWINIAQDKYNRTLVETIGRRLVGLDKTIDSVNETILERVEINELFSIQNMLRLGQLETQLRPNKEPNIQKLLYATVQISDISGLGTGVCVNEDEDYYYILTAQHVVASRSGNIVSVRTIDKMVYTGEILKEDPQVDLALLKVSKNRPTNFLRVVNLAENEPTIADRVWIVGHPLGTYWTFTKGIISNIDVGAYIMTTATLTFGNSGGGVFDVDGNVVGICSKVIGYTSRVPESSMGLAIKLSLIKEFLEGAFK